MSNNQPFRLVDANSITRPGPEPERYRLTHEPWPAARRLDVGFTWDGWAVFGDQCRPLVFDRERLSLSLQMVAGIVDQKADRIAAMWPQRIYQMGHIRCVDFQIMVDMFNCGGLNTYRLSRFQCFLLADVRSAFEYVDSYSRILLMGLQDPEFISAQVMARPGSEKFIYVARDGRRKLIKIGISKNVKQRLAGISNQGSISVKLLHSQVGTEDHEKALHLKFAEHRTKGEWFRDCQEIREWLAAGAPLPEPHVPASRVPRTWTPTKFYIP